MSSDLAAPLIAHRAEVAALCRLHGVSRLEVFGSAADGRFDPARSDFDFIVSFSARDETTLARRFIALAEGLESLLGRHVDLMTDHPIENPFLRQAVEASRRTVFSDEAAEASV